MALPVELGATRTIMVWDVATCLGHAVPAVVEGERHGILRLRVGDRILMLGRDEVDEREACAREAQLQERRVRARGRAS